MKILALTKRVEDPEMKIKVKPDGSGIQTDGMKYSLNPFDEIAVEEALRVRDKHQGEVVVVCIGVEDAQNQIRQALAMGADRAIHVLHQGALDPAAAATAISKIVEQEKPDMVLLGKQAVDDDMGQTGILLAEKLGWGQATFASKEASLESDEEKNKVPAFAFADGRVQVVREIDGAVETLSVAMPAVVTCELRLNVARYASLPNIMKAKKKEIRAVQMAELGVDVAPQVKVLHMEAPAQRKGGQKVADVPALVEKLRSEAKVI